MKYLFGDEVKYKYDLVKPEDNDKLQAFSCGNEQLDYYIQKEMIINGIVDTDDGLPFKVWDINTGDYWQLMYVIRKFTWISTNRKPCCHNIPPPLVGCSLGVSLVSLDNSYIIWSRFGI